MPTPTTCPSPTRCDGCVCPRSIDLLAEDISTIIWSTGFGADVAWVDTACLGRDGGPPSSGSSPDVPGLWFLGVPWQSTRPGRRGTGRDVEVAIAGLLAHLGRPAAHG
ncbi:MAG: hypothetical protein U0667_11375 [Chloroflexota bacterium]